MMRAFIAVVAMLLTMQVSATWACGHCVEDKVAAVYDYAVVTQAFRQKHSVAFFGIDGTFVVNDESRRAIEALVKQAAGIDQGSVRISMESAALSVAFDPRRTSYAAIQKSLEKKLAIKHLTLLLMRVMDEPAKLIAPS